MLIGYARVSTTDQTIALQEDALQKVGCVERIFHDVMTDQGSRKRSGMLGLATYWLFGS